MKIKTGSRVRTPLGCGKIVAIRPDNLMVKVRITLGPDRGVREFRIDELVVLSERKKKDKSWKFKTMNGNAIDWNLIISDLNRDNPIQLITINEQRHVAVHSSLFMKADDCDISMPQCRTFRELKDATIFNIDSSHFEIWVRWAKRVRTAKWINRNPCTVEISMPKI